MDRKIEHNDLLTQHLFPEQLENQFDRFARFYDDDYHGYDVDIDLITAIAADCGAPALELGCGTGRVLLPLAAEGISATGVDISRGLLSVAQDKINSADQGDRLSLVYGDIRTVDLPQRDFRFAYCVSNTLMHCTTQNDQLLALENTFRHLASDGMLLIDLFNPDLVALSEVAGLHELANRWEDGDGNQVLKWSIRSVDTATQLQETCFIYEEIAADGAVRKNVCPFTLRFLWRSEGELLLEKAGFEVLSVWGDFDCEPHHSDSERLIFLARKP